MDTNTLVQESIQRLDAKDIEETKILLKKLVRITVRQLDRHSFGDEPEIQAAIASFLASCVALSDKFSDLIDE